MKGAVFQVEELPFWQRITEELDRREAQLPADIDVKQYKLNFILQTIKSYKPSPNGNGIKWSKEEKEAFNKLTYKEQRKMIVRKSELKSVLFPYVDVDYEPYKYSERISDTAKKAYDKAQNLLANHNFNGLDYDTRQEILHNLRVAYKEQYYKAGVELAKLLFKQGSFPGQRELGNIEESAQITRELWNREKIPESAYMYYQLYKWVKYEIVPYNTRELLLNEEEAKECYNYALECVVWEAIDEEAQRKEWKYTLIKAELYLAAAIKYQSPLAFSMAASSYCPTGTERIVYYAIIPHHACLRCAAALGSTGAISSIEENYRLDEGAFPLSSLKVNQLRAYIKKSAKQRGLINGLDPYFDEKFPPEYLIDVSSFAESCVYGGNAVYLGIAEAKRIGLMKDPRTKGSTMESIKEYYLMMWRIIVYDYNGFTNIPIPFTYWGYITHLIYSNLTYGYPSARPYIFPKEVLDLEIDFNEALDKYGYTHNIPQDEEE